MWIMFLFASISIALGLFLFFKGGTIQYIGAFFIAIGILMFDIIHDERKSKNDNGQKR